jgi:hypothetical protein
MKNNYFLLKSTLLMAGIMLCHSFFSGSSGSAIASSKGQNTAGYSQVLSYLQNCSHHHTVNSIELISGTTNYKANVDNGDESIVNVAGGVITGHTDVQKPIIIHSNGD